MWPSSVRLISVRSGRSAGPVSAETNAAADHTAMLSDTRYPLMPFLSEHIKCHPDGLAFRIVQQQLAQNEQLRVDHDFELAADIRCASFRAASGSLLNWYLPLCSFLQSPAKT